MKIFPNKPNLSINYRRFFNGNIIKIQQKVFMPGIIRKFATSKTTSLMQIKNICIYSNN